DAAARQHQRHRYRSGRVRLVLRPRGCGRRRCARPVDPVRSARNRRQPAGRHPLHDAAAARTSCREMIPAADQGLRPTIALFRPVAVALSVSIAATVFAAGGAGGLAYFCVYALVCATGLPLGFALFGRRHAGAWIAGLLFGYALASLAWWAVVFFGIPS